MPIVVDYSPVGLLSELATRAGRAAGARTADQLALQAAQITGAQQAQRAQQALAARELDMRAIEQARQKEIQDRAFELQRAAASRSPLSDAVKQQLAQMERAGDLTAEDRRQAELGILTGAGGLLQQAVAPKAPAAPREDRTALDMVRQPFRSKRRVLEGQIEALNRTMADPYAPPGTADAARAKIAEIQGQLEEVFRDEAIAVATFRQRTAGTDAAQMGGPLSAPATTGAPTAQMTTEEFPSDWTPEEREISQILRRRYGMNIPIRGQTATIRQLGPTGAVPTPPAPPMGAQREDRKVYMLPDGRVGRWHQGRGWEIIG